MPGDSGHARALLPYYSGTAAIIMSIHFKRNDLRIDPRSPRKRAKDAAFAKLPPAIICKPLRFIADNTHRQAIYSPTGELLGFEPSPEQKRARIAADRGNGVLVKVIANQVAAAYA